MTHIDAITPLYFEDMYVGREFSSVSCTVEQIKMIEFAHQFDPQPFHTNPDAAEKSIFGGLVASGWHTAALTMKMLLEAMPISGGTIGLGGEASWPKPVRAGDSLHVEGKVIGVKPSRSRPDRGIVLIHVLTKNDHGEVVQDLTAKLLVFRRK